MLFNSFEFLVLFLPPVLFVALRLRGQRLLAWISLTSFLFYAFAGHVWFLVPMLVTTCVDFIIAIELGRCDREATSRRNRLLLISLVGNLGLLGWFKYASLAWRTGAALSHWLHGPYLPPWLFDTVLPAGISFYTFQTLAYVIDVWRGQCPPETSFWRFASFISFFPHLVAGPLTRHDQLIPQLTRISSQGCRPVWVEGLALLSLGLIKKVIIGDQLARLVDPIVADLPRAGCLGAWLALLGYSFQIYFDFSGYSDMAIGLGLFFGVRLPQNFNSPYQADSPRDFWRRWHITLSTWLRDYLYFSLGGNRTSPLRARLNLLITMVLGGLWHGANLTFAAWGLYHGLLLAATRQRDRAGPVSGTDPARRALGRALTLLAVCIGWVFFRSTSFPMSLTWLRLLAGQGDAPAAADHRVLLAAVLGCLAVTQLLPNSNRIAPRLFHSQLGQAALAAGTVVAILLINQSSRFLYFQF